VRLSGAQLFSDGGSRLDAAFRTRPVVDPTKEKRDASSSLKNPEAWLLNALGSLTDSGANASRDRVLGLPAVWSCINIIAGNLAQLPLRIRRRTATGTEDATDHPAFSLLKSEPNGRLSSFELIQTVTAHAATSGNGYIYIERDRFFQPVALYPICPHDVEVIRLKSGAIAYRWETRMYGRADIVQIRNLIDDGWCGISPIRLLRETFGLSITLDSYASNSFRNGVRTTGVLEMKGNLGDDDAGRKAVERLRLQFQEQYAGANNSGKPLVLEDDMVWKQIGMSNEDAQFLASRTFQREEIAMIWNVPPHMIGATDKVTSWGTGIEQQQIGFLQFTLGQWMRREEQAIDASLLTEQEKAQGYFTKFDINALQRGDFVTRMNGYATGLLNGVYSINEVRRKEDLPELVDHIGGIHRVPANTIPAGQTQTAQNQSAPAQE
jgi:HK97 family phage portal protein